MGKCVKKEYLSNGVVAEVAADVDQTLRWVRELKREDAAFHKRATSEHLNLVEGPVARIDDYAEQIARPALILAGYHRYKGEWRQRRV